MSTATTAPVALDRRRTSALGLLRTMALAGALACTASGAYASFASVAINGLSISAAPGLSSFLFAPPDAMLQAWTLSVETNNVPSPPNTGFLPDWSNQLQSAQNAQARATYSFTPGFDPLTNQPTPAFTLQATANPLLGVLHSAFGNAFASGGYCFWDSNTNFTNDINSCTGSGSLMLQVDYSLIAELVGPHGPASNAFAAVSLTGIGVPGGFLSDIALAAGGVNTGPVSGSFMWTVDLIPGGFASFDLTGDVAAQGIPEPDALALAALGLVGLIAVRRRRGQAVSAA